MTLKQTLQEVDRLNKLGGEWQYVAYLFSRAGESTFHIVMIPLPDGSYSMETTGKIYTTRQHETKDKLLQMPCAKRSDWVVWKWLPNEERRIFKPAEETMINA